MASPQAHPTQLSPAWAAIASVGQGLRLRHPILTVTPAGRPSAVWEADKSILVSHCLNQVWQPPLRLLGGMQPVITHAGGESLFVAFANNYSGRFEIYFTAWEGGRWSLPVNVSYTAGDSVQPVLVAAADGARRIVWEDRSPGYPVIYHAWRRSDWRWETRPVPNSAGRRPAACLDADGRLHVAFQTGDDNLSSGNVLYTALQNGVWTPPQLISSGSSPAAGVAIGVDPGGMVHAAWRERRPEADVICYAVGRPGVWSTAQVISPLLDRGAFPDLVVAGDGRVHVAWDHTEVLEHALRPVGGASWAPIEMAAAEFYRLGRPSLALDAAGKLHSLWVLQKPEGQGELRYTVRQAVG